MLAKYEYGTIAARKLPPAHKYYVVAALNYSAFLRLYGEWLNDAGFLPDVIATVAIKPGCITLRTWSEPAASYSDIVKFARERKYQIAQPQKNQDITYIDLDCCLLDRAGFVTGDFCGVRYDCGIITLFKPDLQKLGF